MSAINKKTETEQYNFVFGKENYKILLISIAIIIVGFLFMLGGGSDDPTKFNEKELFSFQRTGLSTILVLAGYSLAIFAIMKKRKEE